MGCVPFLVRAYSSLPALRGTQSCFPLVIYGSGSGPWWASQVALVVKNPPGNAGDVRDMGLIPGEGNGKPLQYSCLKKPMDRGTWQAIVHGVAESRT